MRFISAMVISALLGAAASAHAAETVGPLPKEQVTEVVNLLSDCAGYWEFGAELQDQSKTSTVESVRAVSRGAEMAASYLLALEAGANGKKRRPLGDFMQYVEGRKAITLERMRAYLEQQDKSAIQAQKEKCVAIAELQEALIQQVRDGAIDR